MPNATLETWHTHFAGMPAAEIAAVYGEGPITGAAVAWTLAQVALAPGWPEGWLEDAPQTVQLVDADVLAGWLEAVRDGAQVTTTMGRAT